MRRPWITALLVAWLVFGQALPCIGAPGAWSLCLGGDGHVAIEPAHAAPSCEDICAGEAGEPDDHGCVDLALRSDHRRSEARQRLLSDSGPAVALPPHELAPSPTAVGWRAPVRPQRRAAAGGVPPGLRSTVMVI